jgi:hypothetical protein
MKSRKAITHQELVVEVIKTTKNRGVLEPADIKKNIEKCGRPPVIPHPPVFLRFFLTRGFSLPLMTG